MHRTHCSTIKSTSQIFSLLIECTYYYLQACYKSWVLCGRTNAVWILYAHITGKGSGCNMRSRSNVQSSKDHSEWHRLDHVRSQETWTLWNHSTCLSYWHFITVSGVLNDTCYTSFFTTSQSKETLQANTVLAPSLLRNLLILSCPLKLLVSTAKVYTLNESYEQR